MNQVVTKASRYHLVHVTNVGHPDEHRRYPFFCKYGGSTTNAAVVSVDDQGDSWFQAPPGGRKAGGVGVQPDASMETSTGWRPNALVSSWLQAYSCGHTTLRSNRPLAGREGHHPASQRQARGEEGGGGGVIPGMAARSRWLWGPFFFVCSNKGCFLPPGGCRDTASPRCVSDDGLKAMYGA